MFGGLYTAQNPNSGAGQQWLKQNRPQSSMLMGAPQPPPTHQPPIQQPQFGMAQGSAQAMGMPYGGMMGQQDPYGYMPPEMGKLMKTLGLNNTGRFTGFPR